MTVQTIDIHGERFVILSERDFLAMKSQIAASTSARPVSPTANGASPFREVTPLRISGPPASEVLLRDRR